MSALFNWMEGVVPAVEEELGLGALPYLVAWNIVDTSAQLLVHEFVRK